MKQFKIGIFLLCQSMVLAAANYYVATDGNDSNLGTIEAGSFSRLRDSKPDIIFI